MVTEACGHAFNSKCELVSKGVGGRRAFDVATNVASNKAAAKGEAEELLGVREPVSEGRAVYGCLFSGHVRNPVSKGDMGALGGASSMS